MKSTYYSAAWTDSGYLLGCGHKHETLVEAVSCIPCAGGYVVGIENGVMRPLSPKEKSEFQAVIRDHLAASQPATAPAASAARASSDSGYAVMTGIRVVDHWKWTTWMCFDTHGQAVAHAREGDRVVRFESEEWVTLKQQNWGEQKTDAAPPIRVNAARGTPPSRVEGEPLVEFVLRILAALDPAGHPRTEYQKEGTLTSESEEQTSILETPTYMARLILSRLSESEVGQLERMCDDGIQALLKRLRNRSQTVAENKSRCH